MKETCYVVVEADLCATVAHYVHLKRLFLRILLSAHT